MKNKILLIPIFIILIAIGAGIMIILDNEDNDNSKFKKEYGETVPKGTTIIYLTNENIINAFDTEDKLVFIGNSSSKDTKQAVKTLLTVAKDNGIDKIYYYDSNNLNTNKNIKDKLIEKMKTKEIVAPTLFLIKDKKVSETQKGMVKDLYLQYEEIMISYIMCSTPNC